MSRKSMHGAKHAPFFSQNFLTGKGTIRSLVRRSGLTPQDTVIEIGPGKGHITRELLLKAGRVIAVELDAALYQGLAARLHTQGKLTLVQGDFLSYRLPKSGHYKIVANIPFDRTTAIVHKLTTTPNPPIGAWLLMEAGAARALCGQPREDARSLCLKTRYHARIVEHVPRWEFHPAPSVDAALLQLVRKEKPDVPSCHLDAFRAFIQRCQKGGLQAVFTPRQMAAALRTAGIPPGATPGYILYTQWLCLFRSAQVFRGGR